MATKTQIEEAPAAVLDEIAAWAASREGKKEIEEAEKRAEEGAEPYRKSRHIEPEVLRRPITR